MLWRFGLQHASNIDKLLEKEDLTLEEVLNEPDLQQEIREQNPKVAQAALTLAYTALGSLVQPQNLRQMVDYIATEAFFKSTKLAAAACDVLCSNSAAFAEALAAAYVAGDFEDSDESGTESDGGGQAEPEPEAEPRQHLLEQLWGVMG
ncbi:Serine/threonine-protein phosphatase 6 regulatory subunit 2, partial [Coemansia sp. RSA 2702]